MRIKRNILEYFLIRQEFIAPSFQPTFTESFLREDFDFSNYLLRYKLYFLTHIDFIRILFKQMSWGTRKKGIQNKWSECFYSTSIDSYEGKYCSN